MKKKPAGYIAYGILITLIFLYCRFPNSLIEQGIRSAIAKGNPAIEVSLASAALTFPLSVEIEDLSIGTKRQSGAVVIDHLQADLAWGKLLRGIVSCNWEADMYGGIVAGDVGFTDRFTAESPINLNARLKTIDVGACSYLTTTLNQGVTGRLTGTVTYHGLMGDMINGAADVNLSLLDGSMELRRPVLGINALDFDTLAASIVLRDRTLKIKKAVIEGKKLDGSFNGVVFLNHNLPLSRIAVKGRMRLLPLEKNFSVTLSGTLARPRHRIR